MMALGLKLGARPIPKPLLCYSPYMTIYGRMDDNMIDMNQAKLAVWRDIVDTPVWPGEPVGFMTHTPDRVQSALQTSLHATLASTMGADAVTIASSDEAYSKGPISVQARVDTLRAVKDQLRFQGSLQATRCHPKPCGSRKKSTRRSPRHSPPWRNAAILLPPFMKVCWAARKTACTLAGSAPEQYADEPCWRINLMKTIGFVGTAKNTGKTTAALHVLNLVSEAGIVTALTSIGYDGENTDHITGLPKPRYYAEKGMLVATAEPCLRYGSATMTVPVHTGLHTILGEIVIATVAEPGYVVLAGPNRRVDIRFLLNMLDGDGRCLDNG